MNKTNFNKMIDCAEMHGAINSQLSLLQLIIKYYDSKQDVKKLDLISRDLTDITEAHFIDIEKSLPDE